MNPEFFRKLARKSSWGWLRKKIVAHYFRKHGLKLQDLYSFNGDRFFIYRVNDTFIPNENIYWPLSFETQLAKCRNESLFYYDPRPGDTIIDIGAGLGEEMIVFTRLVGEKGNVLAIEANFPVFEILGKTAKFNKLTNARLYNLAIYDGGDSVDLVSEDPSYESGFIKQGGQIPAMRMDKFLEKNHSGPIDLLKVNIEGAERFVVDTLSSTDFKNIRNVAIACHDFRYRKERNEFFKTREHVIRVLEKNGFEVRLRQTGIDYLDDWVYGTNKIE